MKAKELRERRAKLIADSRAILDKAEKDKRDLTTEEDTQFAAINKDIDSLGKQIERLDRQDKLEKDLGDVRDPDNLRRNNRGSAARKLVGADGEELLSGDEALALSVQAWGRQQFGKRLKPQHKAACRQTRMNPMARTLVLPLPLDFRAQKRQFHNNLGVGTGSAGYTIPTGFIANLEMAMLYYGMMLQTSDVIRTPDGRSLPWPTANDTGNTGAQLDEATTIGNSVDIAVSRLVLEAYKFSSKLVKVSAELLEDSAFNLLDVLAACLGERLGRIINTKCTVGDGNSTPNGIVTAATVGKTTASATAIVFDEVLDLKYSVGRAYRGAPGRGFMANDVIVLALRKLKDAVGRYMWEASKGTGEPDTLDGDPIHVNDDMDNAITATKKTLLYGDLSKYKIRLAGGLRMRRLVERYADTDEEGFVGFERADGDLLDAGTHPVKVLQQHA